MSTRKKISAPVEIVSADFRFHITDIEVKAADDWRGGEIALEKRIASFFDAVIVRHGVDLAALDPVKAGQVRSNEAQAAYLFVRNLFAIKQVGEACAAEMANKNISGDKVLRPAGRKPQTKRALQQSVLGSKEWGLFVKRLKEEADRRSGVQQEGRGKPNKNSDYQYVLNGLTNVVKRLSRDVEKFDGSIDAEVAGKLAAFLKDAMKTYGIK